MDENLLALVNGGGGGAQESPPMQDMLMGHEKNILVHMSAEEVQNFSRAQGGVDINPELNIPQFIKLGELMYQPEIREALKLAIKGYVESNSETKQRLVSELDSYADQTLGDEKSFQIPADNQDPTAQALAEEGTRDDTELVLMPEKLVFFLWDQLPPDFHEVNPSTGFPQFGLGSFLGSIMSGVAGFFTGGLSSAVLPVLSTGLMAYGAYDDAQNQKEYSRTLDENHWLDKENFERDQQTFRTLKGMDVPLWRGEAAPKTQNVNFSFRQPFNTGGNVTDIRNFLTTDVCRQPFKTGGTVEPIRTLPHIHSRNGYISGSESGQADNVHVDIPKGSRIIDASTVSALGDGNSLAGAKKLQDFIDKLPSIHDDEDKIMVPCAVSAGEHRVWPDKVRGLGNGSLREGHKIWDSLVKEVRKHKKHSIDTIPPEAKSIDAYIRKRN